MIKIRISYASGDREVAELLAEILKEHGFDVRSFWDETHAGANFDVRKAENAVRDSDWVVVLWSPAWLKSEYLRSEAMMANKSGKLMPVQLSSVAPSPEFANVQPLDFTGWAGEGNDPRIRTLVESLQAMRADRNVAAHAASPADDTVTGVPYTVPPQPSPPAASRPSQPIPRGPAAPSSRRTGVGMLGEVLERVREFFHLGIENKTAKERIDDVRLGASAPRQCVPGQRFTAALVAYVDAARESAREKLEALGEPGDRVVMDVTPQRNAIWRLGAPVIVRLIGDGVDVTPKEVYFEWNGVENLAAFSAQVREDAPASVSLCFEVFLADVPIVSIPMQLSITRETTSLRAQRVDTRLPSSAFASYASKDAQPVTQRLSTLQRWSPTLDIFQDCLDLQPNASFQPQIKAQIARRDVFLLFWSRNAAASRWVQWEYQTARDTRGLDAILPMPLEDPAIAPPPVDLADRHFRDRFMLAGYGLAKIREEASRAQPT